MSPESSSERRSDLITDDKSELKEASAASLWGRFNGPWQDDSSRSALWRWRIKKKKWKKESVLLGISKRLWWMCLITFQFYCVEREMMKMADENSRHTHTGIIEFSFRIAVRQSEWAYSAYYTFRSGLQVSDVFSLHSLCLTPAKEKKMIELWESTDASCPEIYLPFRGGLLLLNATGNTCLEVKTVTLKDSGKCLMCSQDSYVTLVGS